MRRRDRVKPDHPHPQRSEKRLRKRRRRRRVRSMLLAGTALVAPSALKPPLTGPSLFAPETITLAVTPPKAMASTAEVFRLQPESPFEGLINEAAKRFALAPALIRAVIRTESSFDPGAVSSAGAKGLMQLMPALAADMGVADPFDPRENIMAGARYLSALIAAQNGNVALALASYNAGPGAVERYGGIPPFKETQRYVKKILAQIARSELTPD